MRKLVLLLSMTTTGLAIACGYLYRELEGERTRAATAFGANRSTDQHGPSESGRILPEVLDESEDIETADPAPRPEGARESAPEDRQAAREGRFVRQQADLEQRMSEPANRTRRLAQNKATARRQNPGIANALRLSATEEDALMELFASQQLQMQEGRPRPRSDNPADWQAARQRMDALSQQHQQELAELLGPARYEQYMDYRRQLPEQMQLRDLRARLDADNSLTASQTSRLVDAMYQERDSYIQQLKTVDNFGGYSATYPVEVIPNDRDPAARLRFAEEQLVRTEEFMAQLRLRASSVLNAEQLRRFDEIQEEQLSASKSRVERMKDQANRRARRENEGR